MPKWLSRDSKLKELSSKPLMVTTMDALVVSVVSLIVTIIILYLYYMHKETPDAERVYWTAAWQTVAVCMAAQYLYEYTGVNNMIAESSIRYAKGSTLEKYANARDAVLYRCMYYLPDIVRNDAATIARFRVLHFAINNPLATADFARDPQGAPEEFRALSGEQIKFILRETSVMDDAVLYGILADGYDTPTAEKLQEYRKIIV